MIVNLARYIFVRTERSLKSTAVLQTHSAAKLSPGPGPAPEYEAYRRRAARDVQELWLYARARLGSLQQEGGGGAQASAPKSSIRRFVITEKAPTRAFSWDTMLNMR